MVGGFCAAVDDTVSAGNADNTGNAGKPGKFRVPESLFLLAGVVVEHHSPPGIGRGIKKLCTCVGGCEGHDAPVQAPARPAQLSMRKQICFGSLFSRVGQGASN